MANITAHVPITPQQMAQGGAGWDLVSSPRVTPRMIVSTQAKDKSGKTHFGLTMPGPIAFINADFGDEGVIEKFVRVGKVVVKKNFVIPPTTKLTDVQWDEYWYAFRSSYVYAVSCGAFRSVFVDTGNVMWEAQRMEAFGKLTQVPPLKYQEVNQQFEALISIAYQYPVNVTFAHRMKEMYENDAQGRGQKSGNWGPTGYANMRYVVQVNIEQAWNEEKNCAALRINTCRQNRSLGGVVLEGDMCNFSTLGMLVHGPEHAAAFDDGTPLIK
jgi:hypothetical protein